MSQRRVAVDGLLPREQGGSAVDLGGSFLTSVRVVFRKQKELAERAVAQLTDDDLHWQPDPETNSVAIILQHLAGNLVSRWSELGRGDAEKPTRDRDAEFVDARCGRAELLARWEAGWAALLTALDGLRADDLLATVTVRGETQPVLDAIQRALTHTTYHIGQIVYAAKQIRGREWGNLSIPRGASRAFAEARSAAADAEGHRPA